MSTRSRRAVVLLSGGLDSATCLALARRTGFECHALTFDYGQRHKIEIECAARIAASAGDASHTVYTLDVAPFAGSSLTTGGDVPKDQIEPGSDGIPSTYVPARNLVFLSIATAYAETLGCSDLFIGVNAVDYSGYPDCRPEFFEAFNQVIATGTKPETIIQIETPIIHLSKKEIILKGLELDAPLDKTWSCYKSEDVACGICDSCALRLRGFEQAGVEDPIPYKRRTL